ncbi:MAG TPA: Dyp-type peroxidase [Dongiaceae bacterium]|nr:Dyp-type peroxidase [Dongiaceae bacterium]
MLPENAIVTPYPNLIQLNDIQAHLIRGAKPAAARYYFLRVDQAEDFVRFLRLPLLQGCFLTEHDIQQLRDGRRPAPPSPLFVNLAFTWTGLKALGLPDAILDQFPQAYIDGMAARALFLGDYGDDAPQCWEGFYGSRDLHVMVGLNYLPWLNGALERPDAWTPEEIAGHDNLLQGFWQQLCADPDGGNNGQPAGAHLLMSEAAHVIREQGQIREHFGFADGISQPYVSDGQSHRGGGGRKMTNSSPWEPLAAGEFLLGYSDELAVRNHQVPAGKNTVLLPQSPDPKVAAFQRLTHNGSFLVYRKLQQRVKEFRELSTQYGEDFCARLMGREQGGVPLTVKPKPPLDNDFDFGDDRTGARCPFASHMRRANPRLTISEGESEGTLRVDQHRLIRRAMPYGPYIPSGSDLTAAPEADRGLHFLCYNARIDSQFEFVQKNWINSCDFMGFSSNVIDPIVGNRTRDKLGLFSFNAETLPVYGLQQYVHVRGGEYFFTPGRKGLQLLLQLVQQVDPVRVPKQRIESWDPVQSDPLDVAKYVDAARLVAGNRFVKLWVQGSSGAQVPYYYFAYPDDMNAILSQPNVFTNDLYKKRIRTLTGGDMLLSQNETPKREQQKKLTWSLLDPADFEPRMQSVLGGTLEQIRTKFASTGKLELVEHLARRLPLAVIKNLYGIAPPHPGPDGILSKLQIAHFFDRTDYDDLPQIWQDNCGQYGFKTSPDDTLLFWVRMLFLQVFGNLINLDYITRLSQAAAAEFLPQLDRQIEDAVARPIDPASIMSGLIRIYRDEYGISDTDQLVKAVRQSLLELAVGSTDTTGKGIAGVISKLLSFGSNLMEAMSHLLADQPDGLKLLQAWVAQPALRPQLTPQMNGMLEQVVVKCLYMNPVAPLLPRLCLNGATYVSSAGETLNIEPGAMVCLVPQVTLLMELQQKLPWSNGKYLFMSDTPHACMGRRIAILEIREALKLLLTLPNVRPAAGPDGILQEKYRLPASMWLRCDVP